MHMYVHSITYRYKHTDSYIFYVYIKSSRREFKQLAYKFFFYYYLDVVFYDIIIVIIK